MDLESACFAVGKAEREAEKKKEEASLAADVVQSTIGNFGRWQLWVCVWISILKLPVAWHQLGIVFLAPPVDSWCSKPAVLSNLSTEEWRSISQPPLSSDPTKRDNCLMYELNYTAVLQGSRSPGNHTITCHSWEYDRSVFQETIITQVSIGSRISSL